MIRTVDGIKPSDLYTTDGNDVWEVMWTASKPTIELQNLKTGEKKLGCVGCPNLAELVPLVECVKL